MKTINAATLEANCLELIDMMSDDGQPVVTRDGVPIAMISPIDVQAKRGSIIGAMKHGVFGYEDPFSPAVNPLEWDANR